MDNVLIADGDAHFLVTLKNGLGRLKQFTVYVAEDMETVVSILAANRIAILVIGLEGGAFDPLALLSYMSKNHPITPCIVMTEDCKPWFRSRLGQQSFLYYQERTLDIGMLASSLIVGLNLFDLGTNVEGMTLVSLLPMMAMLGRSCRLSIATDNRQTGEMHFRDGILLDARCNGQEGEAAARRMAVWNRIAFDIAAPDDDVPRRIEKDLMEIADATWDKEEAMQAPPLAPYLLDSEVILLEDIVLEDPVEAVEERESGAVLYDELPTSGGEGDEREAAESLLKKLVLDIRLVKGYQAGAILNSAGEVLALDSCDEEPDLRHLAGEMSMFFREAQAASDRMRLEVADALTLHTRNGILLVQKFCSETGTPLCFLMLCSPRGNWYYFKVRMECLARMIRPAN